MPVGQAGKALVNTSTEPFDVVPLAQFVAPGKFRFTILVGAAAGFIRLFSSHTANSNIPSTRGANVRMALHLRSTDISEMSPFVVFISQGGRSLVLVMRIMFISRLVFAIECCKRFI